MHRTLETPVGDVAREATASRGGYLYQDYTAALEWLNLGADEILHLEVAEDYLKASGSDLLAAQVKALARKMTLNDGDARRALASFVELVRLNPKRSIRYLFVTTATASIEKKIKHRAGTAGSLPYWEEVRKGGDVAPLRTALLAMDIVPELRQFIEQRSDEKLVSDLVMKFEWLLGESSIDELDDQLTAKIAEKLVPHGIHRRDGGKYAGTVMLHVQRIAQLPRDVRRLDQNDLTRFLESIATKTIGIKEHEDLTMKAAIAGNLPVGILDEKIEARVLALRHSRNFIGYDKASVALGLATDVRSGGQYAGASRSVRATALAWAGRALVDDQREVSVQLIDEAKALDAGSESVRQAEAFLVGGNDLSAAISIVASMDSRESMTVRYMLHRRAAKPSDVFSAAVQWFESSGLSVLELDEDGQALVLSDLMYTERWEEAAVHAVTLQTLEQSHPNLLLNIALCELAKAVPEERRSEILSMPPLWDPLDFPLADTGHGQTARAHALFLFTRLHDVATTLGLEDVQLHIREYVLWLTLAISPNDEGAVHELESRVVDSQNWARWIPLALSAGIKLDKPAVREKLQQRYARDGALGFYGARALLALLVSTDPRSGVDDWPRFRLQLSKYFEEGLLISIETQMYLRAGRIAEATKALEALPEGEEEDRIRRHMHILFAKGSGGDVLAMRRAAYQETGSAFDLEQLIASLAEDKQWAELAGYAREMFARSKTIDSAERYVDALRHANQWDELVIFLSENPEFVKRSRVIAETRAFISLFQARWDEVREAIDSEMISNGIIEAVRKQLSVLSMQWQEFNGQIDTALANSTGQSAETLLQLAAVSATLGRKAESRLLTVKAATLAPADPNILMAAFLQATKGMWDGEQEAGDWLKSAVSLSTEDGPLQSKSIGDLIELAPRWRKQSETHWASLQAGAIWLEAYAKLMNQQLSHVTVGSAIANKVEADVRRRAIIPAFSGNRTSFPLGEVRRVAMDPTSLMTLALLGLMAQLSQTFEKIYVPYDTGAWLFEEFQHAEFHQPRQIEDARQLLSYIAQEKIRVCPHVASSPVSTQIGVELADLLSHAQTLQAAGEQAFVVRVAPVHVVSSMLEKEAELGSYAEVLRSTLCLVDSLEAYGAISTPEKDEAMLYLRSVDRSWEADTEIPHGAFLLLDDLSVTYLQHVGLFEKLLRSGFRLMVHEQMREEAKNYESVRDSKLQLHGVLSNVREFLSKGVREGLVEVLPASRTRWGQNKEAPTPATDLFELLGDFDAIIVDDRFFNRYHHLEREGRAPLSVICTLDVLDLLRDSGKITERQWLSLRSDLRRGGYALIPVSEKELEMAADNTQVRSGKVIESVELRAIRENVALVQIRDILILPLETVWLTGFVDACKGFLSQLWAVPTQDREAGLSDWVLELADLRSFGNKFQGEMTRGRWRALGLIPVVKLLIECMFDKSPDERRERLSLEIFDPLAWHDPKGHAWLLDQVSEALRDMSVRLAETLEHDVGKAYLKLSISRAINQLPTSLRKQLLEDRRFIDELGLSTRAEIKLNIAEGPRFEWNAIWTAVAQAVYAESPVSIKDTTGKPWELDRDETGRPLVRVDGDARPLVFRDVEYMAPEAETRLEHFRARCSDAGVDIDALADVAALLSQRPLSPGELEETQMRFDRYPLPLYDKLCADIGDGQSALSDLFPGQFSYYQSLVGDPGEATGIAAFAANRPARNVDNARYDVCLKLDLLLSAHSSTIPTVLVAAAEGPELKQFIAENAATLDVWSLTGLIEALAARKDVLDVFSGELQRLLELFETAVDKNGDRLQMTAALCKVADNRIRRLAPDESLPPNWRRMAAIAHAALIERAVLSTGAPIGQFTERMESLDGFYNPACVVDMRREPRWASFLMVDHQLRQELIGRVLYAWSIHIESSESMSAAEGIFKPLIDGLLLQRKMIAASAPGPLEGNVDPMEIPQGLSDDLMGLLEDDSKPRLETWLFVAAAGAVGILPARIQEMVRAQLENEGRSAFSGSDEQEIAEVVLRLAHLAAASRDTPLAKAVVKLCRDLSPDSEVGISASVCLYLSLVATAAYSELEAWREEFIGCVNYAANTCREKTDANSCLSLISGVIEADWTLGLSLAKPRVALGSLLSKA